MSMTTTRNKLNPHRCASIQFFYAARRAKGIKAVQGIAAAAEYLKGKGVSLEAAQQILLSK